MRGDWTRPDDVRTPTQYAASRACPSLYFVRLCTNVCMCVQVYDGEHARSVGHERERLASVVLSCCTGCYNERDVISGISSAEHEEEARSVGW